ncbi:hypothetical protein ACWGKW_35955 [Streptomyces sp. NPDC054766]|uniref:hypothetical protein n=1 Tax=Streptomyces rhizosphaerihabitans TaxID=1266770 RepID=UPI0021BF8160|nr:hypothetical protein [Streptomyces rhizosphaerihabitans]MCT9005573.1 hypothetical protein [Streptomyces rhizosphaerihabitans]
MGASVLAGLGSGVAFTDSAAQSDGLGLQAPQDATVTAAPEGGTAQYRSPAIGLIHYNRETTVTEGRLTVDVSGLTGVAEVAWPDNCTPDDSGTVTVRHRRRAEPLPVIIRSAPAFKPGVKRILCSRRGASQWRSGGAGPCFIPVTGRSHVPGDDVGSTYLG